MHAHTTIQDKITVAASIILNHAGIPTTSAPFWSREEVAIWAKVAAKLDEADIELLAKHKFDGYTLLLLNRDEISRLGLCLGPLAQTLESS